jgi:hypothetical protein
VTPGSESVANFLTVQEANPSQRVTRGNRVTFTLSAPRPESSEGGAVKRRVPLW